MYQRILVPVDGSPTSNAGLDHALQLAKLTGGRLRLVHVVDEMPFVLSAEGYAAMSADVLGLLRESGERLLADARARAESRQVAVETVLLDGLGSRLCDLVAEQAAEWKADVVVLGSHGRHGVQRLLLGSDAEQIARTSSIPVLIVRAAATVPAQA